MRARTPRSVTSAALVVLAGLFSPIAPVRAEPPADVDVILVVEVTDTASWLMVHQEVMTAVAAGARTLQVTLPARTGGSRQIGLERPTLKVSLSTSGRTPAATITIAGKVNATDALSVVTPFEQAAFEIQAGIVPNEVSLVYGLSGVLARLVEIHISRP